MTSRDYHGLQDVVRETVTTDVATGYNTSRKTVERRRDKARKTGDTGTYRKFRLRTRDGEILTEPTLEQVKQLRAEGRVPEWFVSQSWLEQEFGKRGDEASRHGSGQSPRVDQAPGRLDETAVVTELKQQYESQITMLREQLAAEKDEKRQILTYAQNDKEAFRIAVAELSRAVPALHEIYKRNAAQIESSSKPPSEQQGSDSPNAKPTAPTRKKRQSFWQRVTGRK